MYIKLNYIPFKGKFIRTIILWQHEFDSNFSFDLSKGSHFTIKAKYQVNKECTGTVIL